MSTAGTPVVLWLCAAVVTKPDSVRAAAGVVEAGGKVTKLTSPTSNTPDGTSSFTAPVEDKVRLKTNWPVVSDIRRRLTPAVSEDTPRYGLPIKLRKTTSVAL